MVYTLKQRQRLKMEKEGRIAGNNKKNIKKGVKTKGLGQENKNGETKVK